MAAARVSEQAALPPTAVPGSAKTGCTAVPSFLSVKLLCVPLVLHYVHNIPVCLHQNICSGNPVSHVTRDC